jgi:CheY-specific phosphatase CheX
VRLEVLAMKDNTNYNELARKYGLEPIPESVLRLTELVAQQDADLDDIAALIEKDPGLRTRLLRVANPKAKTEDDYTVDTAEGALMRNGMGCVLLLAMGTPLVMALAKTLQTMLSLKLESVPPASLVPLNCRHVLGTIDFSGKAVGCIYLRMSLDTALTFSSTIFGLEPKDIGPNEISDAVGELLNIITGNFKSNLCDAGLDCRLQPPKVRQTEDCFTPTVPGGGLERMAFRASKHEIFVDVTVNPWNG